MADTALDLLTEAFLDLGVVAEGEPLSADKAAYGLSKLNSMLDAWSIERLTIYGSTGSVFNITPGQASYTMGPGGQFAAPRPTKITGAYIRDNSAPAVNRIDLPLQILTDDEYENFASKGATSDVPFAIWVNYKASEAIVTVIPAPLNSNYKIILWQQDKFAELTLYQLITFPPGYREPVVANLVLRLAPSYGAQPSDYTSNLAVTGKRRLQSNNVQVNALNIDPLLAPPYFNAQYGWR